MQESKKSALRLAVMDERFFWEMTGPADFVFLGGIIAETASEEESGQRIGIFIKAAADSIPPSGLEILDVICCDEPEMPGINTAKCIFELPDSSTRLERFVRPSEEELKSAAFAEGYSYILNHMTDMMKMAQTWLSMG